MFISLEEFLLIKAPYDTLSFFERCSNYGPNFVKHYYLSKMAFEIDGQDGPDKWEVGKELISIEYNRCGRAIYFAGIFPDDNRFYLCCDKKENCFKEELHGSLVDKLFWWALIVPKELVPNHWDKDSREEFKAKCWW